MMRSLAATFSDWLDRGRDPADSSNLDARSDGHSEAQSYLAERRAEMCHWLFLVRTGLALGVAGYLAVGALLMAAAWPTAALLLASGYAGFNIAVRFGRGRQWRAAPWAYAFSDFGLVLLLCSFYEGVLGATLTPAVVLVGLVALLLLVYTLLGNPALNAALSLAVLGTVGSVFYLLPTLGVGGSSALTGTPETPMHAFLLVEYLSIACLVTCLLALRLRRRLVAYSTELHRRLKATLEADLEEDRRRQLEAVGQLKRDLIMVLSHELRNPIAPLVSSLEVLHDDAVHDRCNADLAHISLESAREIQQLVGDYTQLTKLLTRPLEDATRRNIALIPLAEATAERIAERVTERDADRPPPRFAFEDLADHAVASDPFLLYATMHALMRRAADHTPEGERITVRGLNGRGDVGFAVHDPMSHLDADTIASLDDLFAPSDERLYAQRATGLELLLARHALHRVGGELRAESNPEHGTTIYCTLPAATDEHDWMTEKRVRALSTDRPLGRSAAARHNGAP